MKATIQPGPLSGEVSAIASKSDVHRLLLCAALADEPTKIILKGTNSLSEDILATADCVKALGSRVDYQDDCFSVTPAQKPVISPHFDCHESGSTLRFLLPVAAAKAETSSFTGSGRLPDRPIHELVDAMKSGGVSFSSDRLPFSLTGRLQPGTYSLPGNVSSQYITGLLFALPLLEGDSKIVLTSELQSASYIDITRHAQQQFGIRSVRTDYGWYVPGHQHYVSPGVLQADGDWSNSSFFLAAGALSPRGVTVTSLNVDSPQGDSAILKILTQFGAELTITPPDADHLSNITVRSQELKGTSIDLTDIPDSLPVLAVLAANAAGPTVFTGGARLRLKESDRIHSVAEMIHNLGGTAEEHPEGLTVFGKDTAPLTGGTINSYNDHRIVMAAAIAAASASDSTTIENCEAVRKSYPDFFTAFQHLGGKADVI